MSISRGCGIMQPVSCLGTETGAQFAPYLEFGMAFEDPNAVLQDLSARIVAIRDSL